MTWLSCKSIRCSRDQNQVSGQLTKVVYLSIRPEELLAQEYNKIVVLSEVEVYTSVDEKWKREELFGFPVDLRKYLSNENTQSTVSVSFHDNLQIINCAGSSSD